MIEAQDEPAQSIGFAVPGWKPLARPSREPVTGRYCRIEPLDPARHAADLHTANTLDPTHRAWTYLPYGPFKTEDAYVQWINAFCLGDDPMFHAIVDLETDKATGIASFMRIYPANGSIEVGHINYSPRLQRTRAATEAMYLMMKRAFDLGYRRYEWKCDALNEPSRTAAKRLGLSYEGVFRQATVYKGRNRDTTWYAAIDTEWGELGDAFRRWLDPENFDDRSKQRTRLTDLTRPILKMLDR